MDVLRHIRSSAFSQSWLARNGLFEMDEDTRSFWQNLTLSANTPLHGRSRTLPSFGRQELRTARQGLSLPEASASSSSHRLRSVGWALHGGGKLSALEAHVERDPNPFSRSSCVVIEARRKGSEREPSILAVPPWL